MPVACSNNIFLKGSLTRDFLLHFFHESLYPGPLGIPLGSFRLFWKFANISTNFRKNLKRPYWYTQRLGGNWCMKKTRSRKSRGTVSLKVHKHDIFLNTYFAETKSLWFQGPLTQDFWKLYSIRPRYSIFFTFPRLRVEIVLKTT